MLRRLILGLCALMFYYEQTAFAVSGFVTPTSVTINFTSASLTDTDNNNRQVFSGNFPYTFRSTDTDMSGTSLGGITIPRGRYLGVQVCYDTARSVKIDGAKYQGTATGNFTDGQSIYSIGTSGATTANALSTTNPGTANVTTLANLSVGNGTNNCSSTTFSKPLCVAVAADQPTFCQSTDSLLDPSATTPDLNLMLDMYRSVGVNESTKALDPQVASYPYATLGKVGAAIHLSRSGSGTYGDIILIFGTDKKLAYVSGNSNGSITGFCTGVGAVTVTAVPSGSVLNAYGPTWVMDFVESTGKVQFAAGNCGSGSTCTSSGINVVNNVIQKVGNTTSVQCVADTSATPSKLGFTYTAGAGNGSATTFTISRIVDPYNLFSICGPTIDSGKLIAGSTPSGATGGTCTSTAPTQYP